MDTPVKTPETETVWILLERPLDPSYGPSTSQGKNGELNTRPVVRETRVLGTPRK